MHAAGGWKLAASGQVAAEIPQRVGFAVVVGGEGRTGRSDEVGVVELGDVE